jgi:hypothetical protein
LGVSSHPTLRTRAAWLSTNYLSCHPGRDTLAPNVTVHNQCHQLISSRREFKVEELDWPRCSLEHRLSLMVRANLLLSYAHIALPDGKRCEVWDQDSYYEQRSDDKLDNEHMHPTKLQGPDSWSKLNRFILAALNSNLASPWWKSGKKPKKNERVYVRLAFLNLLQC